jgi:hypothetical protein
MHALADEHPVAPGATNRCLVTYGGAEHRLDPISKRRIDKHFGRDYWLELMKVSQLFGANGLLNA